MSHEQNLLSMRRFGGQVMPSFRTGAQETNRNLMSSQYAASSSSRASSI